MRRLSDAQIEQAIRLFWLDTKKLGEVAHACGCGIYDLSPWIFSKDAEAEARSLPPPPAAARDEGMGGER